MASLHKNGSFDSYHYIRTRNQFGANGYSGWSKTIKEVSTDLKPVWFLRVIRKSMKLTKTKHLLLLWNTTMLRLPKPVTKPFGWNSCCSTSRLVSSQVKVRRVATGTITLTSVSSLDLVERDISNWSIAQPSPWCFHKAIGPLSICTTCCTFGHVEYPLNISQITSNVVLFKWFLF